MTPAETRELYTFGDFLVVALPLTALVCAFYSLYVPYAGFLPVLRGR